MGKYYYEVNDSTIYELPELPSEEEFATYRKVAEFLAFESVAQWVEYEASVESGFYIPTQEEFDEIAHQLRKADFSEEELYCIQYGYEDVIGARR